MNVARYRVLRDYIGTVQGTRFNLEASAELEMPRGDANRINADQPDTLAVIEEPTTEKPSANVAETSAPEAAPSDRMVRKSAKQAEG